MCKYVYVRYCSLNSAGDFADDGAVGSDIEVEEVEGTDGLNRSMDVSEHDSDSTEGKSLLHEHFEQLGTSSSNNLLTYSTSSMENGSPSDMSRLSRSTSISARFLSQTQMKPNR